MRFNPTGQPVRGFLVTIDSARLKDAITTLDRIEGEGVLYRRVEVETSAGPAFGYEWLDPTQGLSPLSRW